ELPLRRSGTLVRTLAQASRRPAGPVLRPPSEHVQTGVEPPKGPTGPHSPPERAHLLVKNFTNFLATSPPEALPGAPTSARPLPAPLDGAPRAAGTPGCAGRPRASARAVGGQGPGDAVQDVVLAGDDLPGVHALHHGPQHQR